jgi:hypothetical protein
VEHPEDGRLRTARDNEAEVRRDPPFPGVNYPWLTYGCDVGDHVWGGHTGVSTHVDEIRRDFDAIAGAGATTVRWFVFTDGRGGIRWNDRGEIAGLAPRVFEDMDALLDCAATAGVKLCLVLFDYLWMIDRTLARDDGTVVFRTRPDELASTGGQARVLAQVIDPLLDRYGHAGARADLGRAIHSFDVINEPDWVTRGLALSWRGGPSGARVTRPFRVGDLRSLVRAIADRVHARTASLVTVGGARIRLASEWDDPAYGLDFVQLHSYPDKRYPRRDRALLGRASHELGLSRPILIGEFPGNGDRVHPPDHEPPAFSLADYVTMAREGGYLGAWPWSFKGVDGFGALDLPSLLSALDSD